MEVNSYFFSHLKLSCAYVPYRGGDSKAKLTAENYMTLNHIYDRYKVLMGGLDL